MIARLARIGFVAALVFASVMAFLPQPPQLPGEPSDKVNHILAFATLTALLAIGWPRLSAWRILLIMAGYGALIELVQLIPALNRSGDGMDWVADMGATLVVLALIWGWRRVKAAGHYILDKAASKPLEKGHDEHHRPPLH